MTQHNPSTTYQQILSQYALWSKIPLATINEQQPDRAHNLCFEDAGLTLDLSRQPLDNDTIALLTQWASELGLEKRRDALLAGEPVNISENRPAWHTALRANEPDPSVKPAIDNCQASMRQLANSLRSQTWLGSQGEPITDVVTLGIGGSHLGPVLVQQALQYLSTDQPRCHHVANIDPAALHETLASLNPATTLFIIISKSFNTEETLINAGVAKAWLQHYLQIDDVSNHLLAVTAHSGKARDFGVPDDQILPMWDWVGGRYSVYSSVGLPAMIAIGEDHFQSLLDGAQAMDEHFANAPLSNNLPVLLGMVGVWQRNFWHRNNLCVLPYAHGLRSLPAYLQQLEMESNGKQVRRQPPHGPVPLATAPIIWGHEGTNSQHSFHQFLHQGTDIAPVDFILPLDSPYDDNQHQRLVAHCHAQADTLLQGYQHDEPYRSLPGHRPSTMIRIDGLLPQQLGALLALYEHKVFVQSVIWDTNPFDQWGVERGKQMARDYI